MTDEFRIGEMGSNFTSRLSMIFCLLPSKQWLVFRSHARVGRARSHGHCTAFSTRMVRQLHTRGHYRSKVASIRCEETVAILEEMPQWPAEVTRCFRFIQ